MAEITGISWCDHTLNFWIGCQEVSPACDHCYARVQNEHRQWVNGWGPRGERRRTAHSTWQQLRRWNRRAEEAGVRARVFSNSLADFFDSAARPEWRREAWHYIAQSPWLDFLILTKRTQNIAKMLPDPETGVKPWGDGWPNVWLGTTAENQAEANRRIPHLLAVPAVVRFLSCEPLLGPVDLTSIDVDGHNEINALRMMTWREVWESDWSPEVTGGPLEDAIESFCDEGGRYPPDDIRPRGIDWVICGGESGQGARPMAPGWARSLRDQCAGASVPFFFKQFGEWAPARPRPSETPGRFAFGDYEFDAGMMIEVDHYPRQFTKFGARVVMERVGKKAAGDLLDGRQHHEWPGPHAAETAVQDG